MKFCIAISESINKNASSVCDCPKACDSVQYKAAMSYATANQNSENEFDLSDEFLRSVGTHLNKSLDTREYTLHDRQAANMQEVTRVLQELPPNSGEIWGDYYRYVFAVKSSMIPNDRQDVIDFIGLSYRNLQKVLERGFNAGWSRMNVYFDILSDLFMHSKTLTASEGTTEQKQWRADLLKVQLTVSKLSLYHLERVHDAYHRAVPLVDTCVTPNGSYDGLYLTKELFKHTQDINDTYTRLRGHITKYIEHIDVLFHVNITNGHMTDIENTYVNQSNDFWRTIANYERDLKLYESLIIKQPLERLKRAIKWKVYYWKDIDTLKTAYIDCRYNYHTGVEDIDRCLTAYHNTNTTATLKSYFDDLKNERRASKLHLAVTLQSNNIMQLLDNFKESVLRTQERMRAYDTSGELLGRMRCKFYLNTWDPILQAFFSKLHHHLNRTTDSEKSAMEDYFMLNNSTSNRARIVRGDETFKDECHSKSFVPLHSFKTISHRKITSFKKNLDTLLHKTRLDGTMFR